MPSHLHEHLVDFVRERPELVEHLVRVELGLDLGGGLVLRDRSENLSEINPAELRTDAVFEVRGPNGKLQLAVIVEVQLEWQRRKLYTWPAYVTGVRARLRCPVLLLVITTDPTVVRQCARPIHLDGLGRSVFVPCVLGPADVPVVTRVTQARKLPELALLSVIAHGKGPHGEAIGRAAMKASKTVVDDDRVALYLSIIFGNVSEATRRALEASMRNDPEYSDIVERLIAKGLVKGLAEGRAKGLTEGRAKGLTEGRAKGFAEGRADALVDALVAVFEARGLPLSKRQRKRIEASRDVEQLEHWIRQAATAASVSEALEG